MELGRYRHALSSVICLLASQGLSLLSLHVFRQMRTWSSLFLHDCQQTKSMAGIQTYRWAELCRRAQVLSAEMWCFHLQGWTCVEVLPVAVWSLPSLHDCQYAFMPIDSQGYLSVSLRRFCCRPTPSPLCREYPGHYSKCLLS
jgi:hypothetical protein